MPNISTFSYPETNTFPYYVHFSHNICNGLVFHLLVPFFCYRLSNASACHPNHRYLAFLLFPSILRSYIVLAWSGYASIFKILSSVPSHISFIFVSVLTIFMAINCLFQCLFVDPIISFETKINLSLNMSFSFSPNLHFSIPLYLYNLCFDFFD